MNARLTQRVIRDAQLLQTRIRNPVQTLRLSSELNMLPANCWKPVIEGKA